MSDIIKSDKTGMLGLLHGETGGLTIPKPFEQEIFLFDTHIAGTSFVERIQEISNHLALDDKLNFFREPDNSHDSKAIVIRTLTGVKIGYVPKADNLIFARLMDAGKLLFGRISEKDIKGKWVKINIKVYLKE